MPGLRPASPACQACPVFGRLKEQPPPQSLVGTTTPVESAPDRGGSGPREGLILLLFTILTVALSAYVLVTSEHDAEHDPVQKAARGEIKGLNSLSLLREANLRRALGKVDTESLPMIVHLRVSATKVDATVRDQDGNQKLVSVDPSFSLKQRDWGSGDDKWVRSGQIDAGAPERMVKSVAERTRLGEDAIDYVSLSTTGPGGLDWFLALDTGPVRERQWVAAADGSDLRHSGELSQKQKDATAKRKRQFEREQRRAQRQSRLRFACLAKAITAERAQRCIERYP
jgi:hypothetical protein